LGLLVGIVLYFSSRKFAPDEERQLSEAFGPAWADYCSRVKMPWL
jgi:protein-S-isoprenylcysteine O-methyltransferase Ste14